MPKRRTKKSRKSTKRRRVSRKTSKRSSYKRKGACNSNYVGMARQYAVERCGASSALYNAPTIVDRGNFRPQPEELDRINLRLPFDFSRVGAAIQQVEDDPPRPDRPPRMPRGERRMVAEGRRWLGNGGPPPPSEFYAADRRGQSDRSRAAGAAALSARRPVVTPPRVRQHLTWTAAAGGGERLARTADVVVGANVPSAAEILDRVNVGDSKRGGGPLYVTRSGAYTNNPVDPEGYRNEMADPSQRSGQRATRPPASAASPAVANQAAGGGPMAAARDALAPRALSGQGVEFGGSAKPGVTKVSGVGDYYFGGVGTGTSRKRTSGRRKMATGTRAPKFRQSGRGGRSVRVMHREYIADITGVGSANTLYQFPINPGMVGLGAPATGNSFGLGFNWINNIAGSFEKYRVHGMVFEFKTQSATSLATAGNLAMGTVVMTTEYNVANQPFASKIQMENHEGATSCIPSQSAFHGIECNKIETPVSPLYVRTTPYGAAGTPTGVDPRLYDWGNFQLGVFGISSTVTTTQTIGELWVSYDIEFYQPQVPGALVAESAVTDHYSLNGTNLTNANIVSATSPFGTTAVYNPYTALRLGSSSLAYPIFDGYSYWTASDATNYNTLYLARPDGPAPAYYQVTFNWTGASTVLTTNIPTPTYTDTNTKSFQIFANSTGAYPPVGTGNGVIIPAASTFSVQGITYVFQVLPTPLSSYGGVIWGKSFTTPGTLTSWDCLITQLSTNGVQGLPPGPLDGPMGMGRYNRFAGWQKRQEHLRRAAARASDQHAVEVSEPEEEEKPSGRLAKLMKLLDEPTPASNPHAYHECEECDGPFRKATPSQTLCKQCLVQIGESKEPSYVEVRGPAVAAAAAAFEPVRLHSLSAVPATVLRRQDADGRAARRESSHP